MGLIDNFVNSDFFNDRTDKVYRISVTVVDTMGELVKTYSLAGEITKKVIRPFTPYTNEEKTIKADAVLNVPNRLQYFNTSNTSDLVKWQDRYYRVVKEYNRQDKNGYAYKYYLEYLNKDNEINGKLS